jgi:hypothetical protein
MEPSLNVKRLFGVPSRPWPVVNRGNAINRVQKILKENHVTGIPSHWPKIYYGQARKNLAENRTYRNVNAHSLPDGAYLYLIEYNPETNRYHKSFVQVLNKLESGSRHFQLPVRNQGRVIVAAGELSKRGGVIEFNLESGTYTRNLMTRTKNYMGKENYIRLVKNALRNSRPEYTNSILVPSIPGSIKNLLGNRGNVSFFWNATTEKSRAKVLANLKKAGLNTNSARNLIQKLVNQNSGAASPRVEKRKRSVKNVEPRRGRSAAQ